MACVYSCFLYALTAWRNHSSSASFFHFILCKEIYLVVKSTTINGKPLRSQNLNNKRLWRLQKALLFPNSFYVN